MTFTNAAQMIAYNNTVGEWEVTAIHRAECEPHVVGVFQGTRREAVSQARGAFLGCFSARLVDSVRWVGVKQGWVRG